MGKSRALNPRPRRLGKYFFANFAGILIEYAQISLDNDEAM